MNATTTNAMIAPQRTMVFAAITVSA
jgi:hypothetical protein